jgi:hypothetical protein
MEDSRRPGWGCDVYEQKKHMQACWESLFKKSNDPNRIYTFESLGPCKVCGADAGEVLKHGVKTIAVCQSCLGLLFS